MPPLFTANDVHQILETAYHTAQQQSLDSLINNIPNEYTQEGHPLRPKGLELPNVRKKLFL